MDKTGWAEMQQNPNPLPNSNSAVSSLLHTPNYSASCSHNLNSDPYQQPSIDPHNALFQPQSQPPGVEPPPPYVTPAITVEYGQQPIGFDPQKVDATDAAAAAAYYYHYYQETIANWATAAIPQIGATNYAPGATTPNTATKSQKRNTWIKGPKKIKIAQPAWCEVCKVDCNSKDVLDQHKLGKKHQKNLEKLNKKPATIPTPAIAASHFPAVVADNSPAIAPLPVSTLAPQIPIIGPKQNSERAKSTNAKKAPKQNPEKAKSTNAKKAKKKAAARTENLETKRRKVLEGGAKVETVHTCTVCNVVCNSSTVFNYHLAGQRHASMVKKLASGAIAASAMLKWTC